MPGLDAALNIHPLFVHFPIALTLAAISLIFYSFFTGQKGPMNTAAMMIYLAAGFAIVTAITGYIAAAGIGHHTLDHDLVHVHRDIVYWYSGLIMTLALVNFFIRRNGAPAWVSHWGTKAGRMVLLFSSVALLIIGSDRGALLVFGQGVGGTYQTELHNMDDDDSMMDSMEKAADDDHSEHEH